MDEESTFGSFFEEEPGSEEDNWWLTQFWTLGAGIMCGIIANILSKYMNPIQRAGNAATNLADSLANFSTENKMSLVIRTDLGMTKGKAAAQCAHAAVGCYKQALKDNPQFVKQWETFGSGKVTVKVDSEQAVMDLKAKAEALGLTAYVVKDAGRTQVDSGSVTVMAVGPGPVQVVDKVTGHLKLY